MECKFNIEVFEPEDTDRMFPPYVTFRMDQLNFTPQCINEQEIDEQVDMLIKKANEIGKKAKKS